MNLSRLKNIVKQTLFFYCLLLVVGVYAQRYPVQVTQTIIPPYSTKLSDYATASDVKFRLNLLLTDVVANNKQVRLKLRIKGNGFDIQSTDFVAGASQVILNGGVLQQFTNIDLAAYFQPNNLIGISPQQYNKPLPEGMYSFCWEVYDAYTNQQLNHPTAGCSNVYLLLNDPPFLNLPYKGDQIVAQDPMNIIFQWTPRHTNATNVSYEFELRELWDTQVNPQAAFLASPNYYSETTYTTTLLYNIGKPTLLPNRRYGWRVKAKSTTGISENSIFKNDGYSEIYYFTYTNACYPPTFVLSEVVAKDRVKLTWQGHPDHKKYHVQYKRADIPDAEWFEVYTYNTQAQISNLREGKTYMFRVGGTCNELTDFDQNYSYSHMSQFTMPAKDEMGSSYNCGIIPEIQIDNNDPLKNIGINETFTAGDFPVTVKQVQGGNGTFTGVGYIVVPYLGDTKIAVTFDAISINTDYQLIEGVVKTTYDPTWGDVEDTNDWTQGGTGNSESTEVDFPVSDVQIDPNGDILVIGENGEVVELPGGEDIVITDSNGQVWAVDEEGNVTSQGTQAEGGASNPENTNGVNSNGQATAISAKGVIVTFKKASNSKYGFDSYESNYSATKDLYKKLGDNYYVPYKAVTKNDTETIVANLAITDSKIKPQDIVFKTKEGVAITKIDSTATSYILQLKGIFDDAEIETQALVKQGTKYEVAGVFIQYQATPKNVKVVVVNTSNTNVRTIKESLQNIYQQAMVNLTITEINDFKNDLETLAPDGIIQSGESGFAAQYTEQQRQINNKLKQHSQYQQDAYYLIVTDKIPSSASEKGLMPLGRQFGYVYTTNCSTADCVALTAAHELGHGAFQLKHPFSSQSYQYTQKATNWLLDYKGGTKLPFVHWQTIHNPKLRIGIFDKDEEGQQIQNIITDYIFLKDKNWKNYAFLSPIGTPILLKKATHVKFNEDGAVMAFKTKEASFLGAYLKESQRFLGYINSKSDIISKSNYLTEETVIKFNEKRYKEVVLASKGEKVIALAKRMYKNKYYLDCIIEATWINSKKHNKYIGVATPPFIPTNAKIVDIEGTQCYDGAKDGVKEGVGIDIYYTLIQYVSKDGKKDLISFSNRMTDSLKGKSFAFYGYGLEKQRFKDRINSTVLKFLKENKIYSWKAFKTKFPVENFSRDADVIFSSVNLREGITGTYNEYSESWRGGKKVGIYEYSLADLEIRERIFKENSIYKRAIQKLESNGIAEPISVKDGYDEYYGKFQTNSAIFSWAEMASNVSYDVLKAYFSYRLVASQASRVAISYLERELGKQFGKKLVRDAFEGAIIDYGIQASFNYVFDNKFQTFYDAAKPENINWLSVSASAGENAIKYKNIYQELAITWAIECYVNGISDSGGFKESFSFEQCGVGVIQAILGKLAQVGIGRLGKLGKHLTKYTREQLKKGLKKINIEGEKADEIIEAIKKGSNDINQTLVKIGTKIDDKLKLLPKEKLFGNQAETFLNSNYVMGETIENILTYRRFGGNAKLRGAYVSTSDKLTRDELALVKEFNNSMRFEAVIKIPKGEKLAVGKVGPWPVKSPEFMGGADQIIINKYNFPEHVWVESIKDFKTGKIYRYGEFRLKFPNLCVK